MDLDTQLATHLNFTPEDLAANRDGFLTDSQNERLRHLQRLEFVSSTILAPVLMFVPVVIIVALLYFVLRTTYANLEFMWLILLIAIGINLVRFVPAGMKRRREVAADIQAGKASIADGRARISVQKLRRAQSYRLRVGDATFEVPEAIAAAFVDGERYRVYFTPRAMILLSAEAV